ncbi:MAG: hypothetical protein SF162_09215 [bacterium]|nr:hypothetical protein [bacterium]
MSFVVLLGLLMGVGALSSTWIAGWFASDPTDRGASQNADQRRIAARAFAAGDLHTAIEAARLALAAQPDDTGALAVLARALIYRSYADYDRAIDRDLALEVVTRAALRDPLDPDLQAVYAFTLAAVSQPAEAAEAAERVLNRHADNALARTAQALAYGRVGAYEMARRESERAVSDAAGYANGTFLIDALRALAIAQSDLGDYAGAGRTVEQAIALNDHILLLYFEKALYALQLGNTDAATVAYFQVLAVDPENVKARLRLCETSSLLREHEQAITYCTQVTERAPAWADGWYRLGREYFMVGAFEQARDHLRQCSSLQVMQAVPVADRRFECWYLQGQAAEILGDCVTLTATYNEYREMAATAQIDGVWAYPPGSLPACDP